LAPGLDDPKRAQHLRWVAYVSAAIYAFAWIKDDPMRIAASREDAPRMIERVHDRIADCWRKMDGQIARPAGPIPKCRSICFLGGRT